MILSYNSIYCLKGHRKLVSPASVILAALCLNEIDLHWLYQDCLRYFQNQWDLLYGAWLKTQSHQPLLSVKKYN